MFKILSIFIGGGIGATLRYIIYILSKKIFLLPLIGTFIVNIFGCFIIGYIFSLTIHKAELIPNTLKLFITVGFLGSLTTFSTFNLEVFELLKGGKIFYGFSYLLLSCAIGLCATFMGYIAYPYK